jgi:hypothetical protein
MNSSEKLGGAVAARAPLSPPPASQVPPVALMTNAIARINSHLGLWKRERFKPEWLKLERP